MTGGNRSLQGVRAARAAKFLGAIERGQAAADQQLIPLRAVLIEKQNGLSRRAHARPGARRLDFHQRDQAVHFRLLRSEFGQDAPQPQRIFAERRPHPVIAGGRGVTFVEDQVDDLKHRRKARGKFGSARDLKGNALFG